MTLISDLTSDLGSDISAFLDDTGVTTSSGNITSWVEARAGAITMLTTGTIPYASGIGLTFDGTSYLSVGGSPLIVNPDNWAMIAVVSPAVVALSNPIAIACGSTTGVGMRLNPGGALFEAQSETDMSSALASVMQVLTLQRVSGTSSLRINGVDTGIGHVGTAPIGFASPSTIGWDNHDHDKLSGTLRAAIYVPTHPGSSGLSAGEAALISAYVTAATALPTLFHRYQTFSRRRR